jgi:hypothetical protein
MNTQEIENYLPANVNKQSALTSGHSSGAFRQLRFAVMSLDQLLHFVRHRIESPAQGTCNCIIFNCCPSSKPGEHWLVLILDDTLHRVLSWQFFDPLALDVSDYSGPLWALLAPYPCLWQNEKRVQSLVSIQCGEHCLLFLYGYRKYRVVSGEFTVYRLYKNDSISQCEESARHFKLRLAQHFS